MGCAQNVSQVRITWEHYSKLFECSEGCLNYYALLLFIMMVPWEKLRTCHGTMILKGTPGKLTLL